MATVIGLSAQPTPYLNLISMSIFSLPQSTVATEGSHALQIGLHDAPSEDDT